MKNHIFLISISIIFFTYCAVVSAQKNQIGFIAGINIANLEEDDTDFNSLTGFCVGGVIDFTLGEKVSLCLEPMYLQKGASEEEDGGTVDIKLAYIELPVLFKLQFGTGSTKPYLMAGPTIGLNLSADMEVGMGDLSLEVDFSELIETIDYGLAFGGGVSFAVGENSLFIEARYNLGLADIAKEGEIDIEGITLTVPETEIKTSGIQIMAGMTFPL
jgi:opacity protein-like surface antigen